MSRIEEMKADLKGLCKLGLFDIKTVADDNAELTLYGYFENIEKFFLSAPQFVINMNNMKIVRSEAFFLNKLDSYSNIVNEIDKYFINEFGEFRKTSSDIGARTLMYAMEDFEREFETSDLNARNAKLSRLSLDINDIHIRMKRVYTPKLIRAEQAVILPKAESPEEQTPLSQVLKEMEYEERTRKLQIVAVDDMPVVLNSLVGMLNRYYDVVGFTKGEQMLRFLKNNSPDLFLLDIEMPEMDGYELFRAIKGIERHKDTPIIFMTGQAKNEYIETAIGIGISDFIVKPLDEHILLKKIWNNIDRKKLF